MKEQDEYYLKNLIFRLQRENIRYKVNIDYSILSTLQTLGGKVAALIEVENLCEILKLAKIKDFRFHVLGKGSNTFFRGDFIRTPLVRLVGEFKKFEKIGTNVFRLHAGAHFDQICRLISGDGFSGLEFGVGIPGTVGGAAIMNAGAHGSDFGSVVTEVGILLDGRIEVVKPNFGYRFSSVPKESVVLWCDVKLVESSSDKVMKLVRLNLDYRRQTQPLTYPSLGSVFKNPYPYYAAKVLENLGFKGFTVGGCKFSEKHSNWIVNFSKKGTYQNVEKLLYLSMNEAYSKLGLKLDLEWVIVEN